MKQLTAYMIKTAIAKKGYEWFSAPYELNLVGVRSSDLTPNSFNDRFTVSYFDGKKTKFFDWKCTTDPGLYYLHNPANVKGTAIVKPGQYKNSHAIGLHQGKYNALKQVGPITVYRDYDRDSMFDFSKEETGIFGINIHRANPHVESSIVDKWSAGCQVIATPGSFRLLMEFAFISRQKGFDTFTYTLLEEKDLV